MAWWCPARPCKHAYRDCLRKEVHGKVHFILLDGSRELIGDRMKQRKGHFMPPALLDSQFATLEKPTAGRRCGGPGYLAHRAGAAGRSRQPFRWFRRPDNKKESRHAKDACFCCVALRLRCPPWRRADRAPKFPTPPPPVTAENSIIGPDYADAPESVANRGGAARRGARIHPVFARTARSIRASCASRNMQRDAHGNYVVPAERPFGARPL